MVSKRVKAGIFLSSLGIALGNSADAFGQMVQSACSAKEDETPRVRMQLVIPQNEVRVRFQRELQRYAAKYSMQFSIWGPFPPGWSFEGQSYFSLLKRMGPVNSVYIALVMTAKKDTFEVEVHTCNFYEDWQPYWRDFQAFAEARHYRLTERNSP